MAEQRQIYDKVSQERNDAVIQMSMNMRADLDSYATMIEVQMQELNLKINHVTEHVGQVVGAQMQSHPVQPGS